MKGGKFSQWFRGTTDNPEGNISHYGDCAIYSLAKICDCGLIRTLMSEKYPEGIYKDFWKDYQNHFKGLSEIERAIFNLGFD